MAINEHERDAVIVAAVRTAVGKARKEALPIRARRILAARCFAQRSSAYRGSR